MIRKCIRFINAWLPPLIIMMIIFHLSSKQSIAISEEFLWNFIVFKTLHVLEYGLLSLLLFRAFFISQSKKVSSSNYRKYIIYAAFIAIAYGITDELHQTFVPTRTAKPRDVFIDSIGILMASYFLYKTEKLMKKLLSYTTLSL